MSETLHIDDITSLILAAQAAAYDAEGTDSLPVNDIDGTLTRMAGTVLAFARDNGFDGIPVEFLRIACRMADEQNAHFAVQVVYDEYCRDRHAEETIGISRYNGSAYDVEKAHELASPQPEPEPEPEPESGQPGEDEDGSMPVSEGSDADTTKQSASEDASAGDDAEGKTVPEDSGDTTAGSDASSDADAVATVDEANIKTEAMGDNVTEGTLDANTTNASDGSAPEDTEISTENATDEVSA